MLDKSKYFCRTIVFSSEKDKITLVDINNPSENRHPLEPWLGLIYSLADGQHTLQQLIEYLTGLYKGTPPDELEKTVDSVIQRLTELGVVKLVEQPVDLPYYLSLPTEQLDLEAARQSMIDDGYLPH